MKKCKRCGEENRDEAKFCGVCGVPLSSGKKKEKKKVNLVQQKQNQIFWIKVSVVAAIVMAVLLAVKSNLDNKHKESVITEYSELYSTEDTNVLSAVNSGQFALMNLIWSMNVPQAKLLYRYAEESNDPDFQSSLMVSQSDFKQKFPHANFMSLGFYDGLLYGVKYEFAATPEYQRQQVKVPDKDEKLYGRFLGLLKTMTRLYGAPSFSKFEVKNMPVPQIMKYLKRGTLQDGTTRSNIYLYWMVGDTKVELVVFGSDNKIHLTVRFLYNPVWKNVGK